MPKCSYLPASFNSVQEYIECHTPLVVEEGREKLRQAASSHLKVPFQKVRLKEVTQLGPEFLHAESSLHGVMQDERLLLTFDDPKELSSTGDVVLLKIHSLGKETVCCGIVLSSSNVAISHDDKSVNVLVCQRTPSIALSYLLTHDVISDALAANRTWQLTILCNLTTSAREYQAILKLNTLQSWMQRAILTPRHHGLLQTTSNGLQNRYNFKKIAPDLHDVLQSSCNDAQVRAIETSVVDPSPITLIQGPPGTGTHVLRLLKKMFFNYSLGKTFTIMGIVSACLAGVASLSNTATSPSDRKNKSSKKIRIGESLMTAATVATLHTPKILICAPSNAAVDEIVIRILKSGVYNRRGETCHDIRLMRLGRIGQASIATHPVCLENLLKQVKTSGVSVRTKRQDLIQNAQIICCTLSNAGSLHMSKFEHAFDMVIIDEGCQVGK